MDEEMIEITKNRYLALLKIEQVLYALNAAGVDDWEGFDNAMDMVEDDNVI